MDGSCLGKSATCTCSSSPATPPRPLCLAKAMMMNYLSLGIVHITFSAVELSISAFFAGISVLLSSFEDISSRLFERASDFSGVPPRASFPTEKCAILILGAQEGASFTPPIKLNFDACTPESGVGQNAALRFSELGYTVFALCPNRHEHSLSSGGKSTDVASVRSIIQLFLASAYLPQKKNPPIIPSFYTPGTIGKKGHGRFHGAS